MIAPSQEAALLAEVLVRRGARVVLAESCTAGLASACIAQVPGISAFHCGSAVTYRDATKHEWLGISAVTLQRESAVSEAVAREMALGVLAHTSEASVAGSITGHLGPDAPADLDGVVYVGLASRAGSPPRSRVHRQELEALTRRERQWEAAQLLLRSVRLWLED